MRNYVLGFLFSPGFDEVVLVNKEGISWKKHQWSGVGGMAVPGEPSHYAMQRVFERETGICVADWRHYVTEFFPTGKLEVFWAASEVISEVSGATDDDQVAICEIPAVMSGAMALTRDVAYYVSQAIKCHEMEDVAWG